MTLFRFRFDPHPDTLSRNVEQATRRLMQRLPQVGEVLGRYGSSLAQDEAPKDTGRFAASHGHEVERMANGVRIRVGAGVGGGGMGGRITPQALAQIVIGGSRPHPISGNPLLAFYWERVGKFMVVPSVHHPGTRPNDYMARMFRRWQPRTERAFQALAEEWIRDLG